MIPIIGAKPSTYEAKIIQTLQEFGKILDEHSEKINLLQRTLILLNQKVETLPSQNTNLIGKEVA